VYFCYIDELILKFPHKLTKAKLEKVAQVRTAEFTQASYLALKKISSCIVKARFAPLA